MFICFDIEAGGDDCGILQISDECFNLNSDSPGKKITEVFNSYVKPPLNVEW